MASTYDLYMCVCVSIPCKWTLYTGSPIYGLYMGSLYIGLSIYIRPLYRDPIYRVPYIYGLYK